MQNKVKVGVIGIGRGNVMIDYCAHHDHAELVAICDMWEPGLENMKKTYGDSIAYYTSFDEFLCHDMDVVILANYATEHAPFAIKALNAGKHVFSEVLPAHCLAEAVELVETVERTGLKYCYLENYCYMSAPREMKRLFRSGALGDLEYAEAEYIHNCESIWPSITYGERDHWRNHMFSTFYCTHSIGPLVHITGMRPIKVNGLELPFNERSAREGCMSGSLGIEMMTMENGAIMRSTHRQLAKNSCWYSVYGTKGHAESAREITECGGVDHIYTDLDKRVADFSPENSERRDYYPKDELSSQAGGAGHGGSDFYAMYNAIEYVRGNPDVDIINVYEAMDMYLPGLFAYFSILEGGIEKEIPDLRLKENRDKYRNDRRCTDPKVAGDQLLPCNKLGNPDIPEAVYERMRKDFGR